MLAQIVERLNKNHKIIPFSTSLCLLLPLFVWYSPSPAPLVLILKGNIQHHHVQANVKVDGDHGTTPHKTSQSLCISITTVHEIWGLNVCLLMVIYWNVS